MLEVRTLREANRWIEREYLELPRFAPIANSLPRGMEHSRKLLRQLAAKLTGLVWRMRDPYGNVRLVYFNAYWNSYVTLSCAELFAYIGNLWSVDYLDEPIQQRIYRWLLNHEDSTLPFAAL